MSTKGSLQPDGTPCTLYLKIVELNQMNLIRFLLTAHHLFNAEEVGCFIGNGTHTWCRWFCHYIFTTPQSQHSTKGPFSAFSTSRLFTDSDFDIWTMANKAVDDQNICSGRDVKDVSKILSNKVPNFVFMSIYWTFKKLNIISHRCCSVS